MDRDALGLLGEERRAQRRQLRAFGRGDQVAALDEAGRRLVVVEVRGERIEDLPRAPGQLDVLRHRVVGAQDSARLRRGAGADLAAVEHDDVARAEGGEVVGDRHADHAGADHDDIVGRRHGRCENGACRFIPYFARRRHEARAPVPKPASKKPRPRRGFGGGGWRGGCCRYPLKEGSRPCHQPRSTRRRRDRERPPPRPPPRTGIDRAGRRLGPRRQRRRDGLAQPARGPLRRADLRRQSEARHASTAQPAIRGPPICRRFPTWRSSARRPRRCRR